MASGMKLKKILSSKYVLYGVLLIALANVVGYVSVGDYDSLIFFCVIGLLSSYFSKNMIVILTIAVLATNIAFASDRVREKKVREGMKNKGKKEGLKKKKEGLASAEKKKEKYTQKNVPVSKPAPATESEEDGAIGKRIDYASTMEKAYDNLSKMLGPKGLSTETKNLVEQQKGLLKNLNNMAPVLKSAKETMDSLGGSMPNLKNLNGLMEKFGSMMGNK